VKSVVDGQINALILNSLASTPTLVVSILLFIVFAGCSRSQTANIRESMVSPERPYVKVFVSKSGQIILDGRLATIDEVGTAFKSLSQKKGVVVYARESPEEYEPHLTLCRLSIW
jgi:hypothetical protein